MLNILIDKEKSHLECKAFITKIPKDQNLREIICLLILKDKNKLVNEILKEYDFKIAKIAIENDNFEILFKLRDEFPQEFIKDEKRHLESILTSFAKSNHCYLAK